MTQRDGIGREVGGGFRIGNTCGNLWWIHVDVWQNQYNIVKLKKKKRSIAIKMKVKTISKFL